MNLLLRIINWCTPSNEKAFDNGNNILQLIIFNFLSAVTFITLLIVSVITVIQSHFNYFIVSLVAAIAIFTNQLIFRKKPQIIYATNILFLIFSIVMLWAIITGTINNQGILFYTLYPVIAISLLKKKHADRFVFVFLIITIAIILLPGIFKLQQSYTLTVQILYILFYIILYVLYKTTQILSDNRINELISEIQIAKQETQSKEEFISKISHQIRTPLNNLVVVTNLVNNSNLDDKQRDLIDTIQASTNNLVNVVNNITELSNVDVLQSKDYNQNFNLETLIKSTINLFDNESNQINFDVTISSDINFQLYGDPVKLKQVFLNLIENILKNSKPGAKNILIDIQKHSEWDKLSEIYFGISTRDLTQIAELTKIQNTEKTKKGKNTAVVKLLDFNIANRIIESYGGSIETNISSEVFEFKFVLKLTKSEILKEEQAQTTQSEEFPDLEKPKKVDLKDANVLLVEDNLINQKIVLLSLKKAVKSVEVANNGKEALDKFGSAKYDIILMDIQMPIMNGIVTTKKIRNIEKSTNSHTPIIAITANALLGDKEECLAAGMDDYISKPFQIETLITKMEKQLES